MEKLVFNKLSISDEVRRAIADMGFEEATPIQSLAIPQILEGKDVAGQAQTGTGKTAAFGIPIIEKIDEKIRAPQALIMCPTRELALQVGEELQKIGKYKRGINILPVYGGQPIGRQIHALVKGVHIIIGTPGRLMDHLERKTLKLDNVKMVVLDEADEMLDMGFIEDIESILKKVPAQRQTVFFSATMPRQFMELTKRYQKHPVHLKVAHDKMTVPNVEQSYYEVKEHAKLDALCRIIDIYDPKLSLVFCNTKRKVDELISHMQARGYSADGIHGDMNQSQRDRVMGKFRAGTIETLVATDVAARGIDVDDVEAVFNYDIPHDEESYVHRIGRTARAGKAGSAFTFVSGREIFKIKDIMRYTKSNIKLKKLPTQEDVEGVKVTQFMEKIKSGLSANDLGKYVKMLEKYIDEEHTSLDVAAVCLKMLMKSQTQKPQPVVKAEENTFGDTGAKERGMVRLFMNVGKQHNVRPGDIVGAIAGETGIEGNAIGNIAIYDAFSFVEVPQEKAEMVMSVMKKRNIKGNKVIMEPANKKKQ